MARFNTPASSGGNANTGNFIFNENEMYTETGNLEIYTYGAPDEPYSYNRIDLYADRVTADVNESIYLTAGQDVELTSGNNVNAKSWYFKGEGDLELPDGGKISSEPNSSGDGLGASTLQLTPDKSLDSDQYIVLDPTQPNHIHIRAGGDIDESSSELILGGEKTNLKVVDDAKMVYVNTYNVDEDNYYSWSFDNNGAFTGPDGDAVIVYGISGAAEDTPLSVTSYDNAIVLNGNLGEFLNDAEVPTNQIATLGDIGVETEYAVQGGTSGTQPSFDGDPLFSASYIRMSNNLVHFQIQVDMDNITNFGTGQYYMTLPFNSKYGYQFREGCLHDISGEDQFQISGHVYAGSNVMELFFAQQAAQDEPFTSTAPVTLQTNDNFHISGTFIAEVEE